MLGGSWSLGLCVGLIREWQFFLSFSFSRGRNIDDLICSGAGIIVLSEYL